MKHITNQVVVLTLTEAAKFLRVKKTALQKMVDEGRVPARKIGNEWRFLRSALEGWLAGKSDARNVFLEQAGVFRDDESLMPMLDEIYKARGRSAVDNGD